MEVKKAGQSLSEPHDTNDLLERLAKLEEANQSNKKQSKQQEPSTYTREQFDLKIELETKILGVRNRVD